MSGSECRDNEMEIDPKCTDGVVAALEGDCLSFNVCVSGQYQKINCPNGYYYNVPNAKCQPINYDADYKCNCVVPDHTLMANPNNCETFYLCEGKKAVLENCSRGQYYNSTQNACLRDNEGICLMEATRSPEMEIEPELEDIQIKTICEQLSNEESVYYPYDNDCSKFLMCTNGRLTLQQCPQKFYYDSNKNYCVLDDEHKCQNSDVKSEEEQSPNKENEAPVIADSKRSKYIAIHNKLFARFMKY